MIVVGIVVVVVVVVVGIVAVVAVASKIFLYQKYSGSDESGT